MNQTWTCTSLKCKGLDPKALLSMQHDCVSSPLRNRESTAIIIIIIRIRILNGDPSKDAEDKTYGVSEKWRIPKTIGFKTNMIWGYTHDIETSMFEPTKRKRKTQRKTKPPMPPFPSVSPSQWLQAVPAKQLLLNGFCLLPLTFQFEDSTCNIRR